MRNDTPKMASAIAGIAAALCCSFVWLSGGLLMLASQGGVALA